MGCKASRTDVYTVEPFIQKGDRRRVTVQPRNEQQKLECPVPRLLEKYIVGCTLGEGAFGVVSVCRKHATGEEFAVKMVDKVETPVENIKREAAILQYMDHPNIVRCHDIFHERCFICIVMDKFDGGDLVQGLQRQLQERRHVGCQDVVHLVQQIGASIEHMHSRCVVHRDIKGDNYVMDRRDLTDPMCHIALTDFGTAIRMSPNERFSELVGTKLFWAPEVYDQDYGAKVDVWAMGILTYGLVTGRFPFRDEHEIRSKVVRVPRRVHPACQDLIKELLDKCEDMRPSSSDVMTHAWISAQPVQFQPVPSDVTEESDHRERALVRDGANDGVKERRRELMKRLDMEHNARAKVRRATRHLDIFREKEFVLSDKQEIGARMRYEWWSTDRLGHSGILGPESQAKLATPEVVGEASNLKLFAQMLKDHNIDPDLFGKGKAKTLQQLAKEVRSGAARLMLDATKFKRLVRVVEVVVLRLRPPRSTPEQPSRLVIETQEEFPDKRLRETLRLPGTKKEAHENTRQTAARIVHDILGLESGCVEFFMGSIKRYEEEAESPSYPGFRTVYRKEVVDCRLLPEDALGQLSKVGLPGCSPWCVIDPAGSTRTLSWMSDSQAESKGVQLKAEQSEAISALVLAPIGLSEEALRAHLISFGIDVDRFSANDTKSLKEFSAELIRGESMLMQDTPSTLKRVVEVVALIMRNQATEEVLVQTEHIRPSGHRARLNRLPEARRRPDESQFLCARRVVRRQLELDENQVVFDEEMRLIEEEHFSCSYLGLKTVSRKYLVRAELTPSLDTHVVGHVFAPNDLFASM
mmetsp:Transcript_14872/g.41092  ORF Transcript_14872/g.41092 Transcript_14872/m.41092 type:complete len:811 (-) Transcript_14872:130-2562(-)